MSPEINPALVARLLADQFPHWAHLSIRPVDPGGWDNRTFRLGEDMSVRLPSAREYAGQIDKEQRWLPKLAPTLPVQVPVPVALGSPAHGYPWRWSVYEWLEGESAASGQIRDLVRFASDLARFLLALQRIDPHGGPLPGTHNFYRGGPLQIYGADTEAALSGLSNELDVDSARAVWNAALATHWQGRPVWLHGDVTSANLLVKHGELSAVIDFGCSATGDPACDLTIAWTLFSGESREAFRRTLSLDPATWARARGWALWKALITLAEHVGTDLGRAAEAKRVVAEVLREPDPGLLPLPLLIPAATDPTSLPALNTD